MMLLKTSRSGHIAAIAGGLLVSAGAAQAIDFDFSGNFTGDADVLQLNYSIGAPSTVTIFSSSWLSGDGGGFDPILAIWTSAGMLVNEQDDGQNVGTTLSNGVPYDHGVWDSYFTLDLPAGDYIATIGQYNNFAVSDNLADGFQESDAFFTAAFGCSNGQFCGVWTSNDNRTSAWEFHILGVDDASVEPPEPPEPPVSVPEPASLALLGLGLLGLAASRRRRVWEPASEWVRQNHEGGSSQ